MSPKKNPDLDPGIESKRDNDIHPLSIYYIEADEAYQEAREARNDARDKLVAMMNRKGRGTYVADGVDVEINSSVTIKVKRTDNED